MRHAARMFVKQPAFAATAILTLALGIGAATAMFSVVYGVLLKPLPFDEPERLVTLRQHAPHGVGANHGPTTYLTYLENQQAFEAIGAWDGAAVSITGTGNPERVEALRVSASTLPLLRVQPMLGRGFTAEDDVPGSPLRVVLSNGYWQRRFGGADNIIGEQLVVDGAPAEVIGILPASFAFLSVRPEILLPLPLDANAPRGISFGFQAIARLKPNVTLTQANADEARMISLLPPVFSPLDLSPDVSPLADEVTGGVKDILWILLAAVSVVLLIACGNVANLFLIRAEGRQQELAMRTALGASRARIARGLLLESVLLGIAGGVVGLVLTQLTIVLLRKIAPAQLPRLDEIALHPQVLAFTAGISILSGFLFGAIVVFRFGVTSTAALREGGRSSSDAPGRHRTRNALVVAQIALALMLLVVSGLMIRTFIAMQEIDPGFSNPRSVQTFELDIPTGTISDANQTARTYESIAEKVAAVPGVTSVGLSSSITMDGEDNGNVIEVEDFPLEQSEMAKLRRFKTIGPGYLDTMGNHMAAGRSVSWADIHEQRPVIIISEALAREYWREPAKAIGRRIRGGSRAPWREIIGVSGDERDDGLNRPATAIVYWPMLSESYRWRRMIYTVRSERVGSPGFIGELERAVWSVHPDLPVASMATLEEIQAHSMAQTSFAMTMLAIAASVALLIGIVGIYSVTAYAAAQRTREIGIRMALGAQIADVRALFLRHGLALTATGIALGIGIALLLTRVLSSRLFGVEPTDPATYVAVSLSLGIVSLAASYLPARRAARVDPVIELRSDR